jgi:hypothetical protein
LRDASWCEGSVVEAEGLILNRLSLNTVKLVGKSWGAGAVNPIRNAARPLWGTSTAGWGVTQNWRDKPMQRHLAMLQSKRCGAHSRRSGKPCQSPAMKNGRCRMHGGKSTGAPRGNRNVWKHGRYSAREVARRMAMKYLLRKI